MVSKIFEKTDDGQKFIKKYSRDVALSIDAKNKLAGLIASYFSDNNLCEIGRTESAIIAKQIVQHYPKESSSSFYNEVTKTGIFYQKAMYIQRKKREGDKSGKVTKRRRLEEKPSASITNEIDETISSADSFVQINYNEKFDVLLPLWKLSAPSRFHSMKSQSLTMILEKYKAYTFSYGYQLVRFKESLFL